MKLAAVAATAAVLAFAGCGGSTSSSPSATPTTPVDIVPTRLTFTSGESGAAIANARVVISGQTQQTDATGGVAVPAGLGRGAFIDVVAAGFLDRQTSLRGTDLPTRLTLWPRATNTGLDENTTAVLVFTSTVDGAGIGAAPLRRHRPGVTQVYVRLTPDLLADPETVQAHQAAADAVNEASGGRVIYQLSAAPPLGGSIIDISFEPTNSGCTSTTRAFTSTRSTNGAISGGIVVYCVPTAQRSPTIGHELGHTFGLYHSPNRNDLMFPTFVGDRSQTFTTREAQLMRLMMDRSPGTLFPDNDRDTTGATSTRTETIRCPLGS